MGSGDRAQGSRAAVSLLRFMLTPVIGANLTTKCPHEVTWKQIVSTFIKHSLQEINITKIFPPKLAYFFNQCIIVNQLAVFKQQYFFEDR